MDPILEVKNITKVYGEGVTAVVAVDSVTLTLNKYEVLLIMGPSGSGKTTLLSIMGCILRPTQGEVMLNGEVVSSLPEDSFPHIRKQYLGFVFQSFNLFPSLTAAENIEVVLRLKGLNRREIGSKALGLLEKVGLTRRAHSYPKELSGGEQQRVAIARALAGDPSIILADEPTGNLDSKTGKEILGLMRDFAEESGKAVAIVSHDPKAEALAHRIVFLEDGRLKG